MARRVPKRSLYHETWRNGRLQNSRAGNAKAFRMGDVWVDNDWNLSEDRRTWENRHGWPEQMTAQQIKATRNAREAFMDAEHFGQSVEAEIKNLTPITDEQIREALARMKRHAITVFGERWWRTRVNLKIVSAMGPPGFAMRVCRIGHELDFVTLLTVRGKDRFRTKPWPAYVDLVRNQVTPVR